MLRWVAICYEQDVGHLHVEAILSAVGERQVRMLVDTGATYSFVSEEIATAIGAPRLPQKIPVTLADGTVVRLEVGLAKIALEGREPILLPASEQAAIVESARKGGWDSP